MTELQRTLIAKQLKRWHDEKEKYAAKRNTDKLSTSEQVEIVLRVFEAKARIDMIDTILYILGADYRQIEGEIRIFDIEG